MKFLFPAEVSGTWSKVKLKKKILNFDHNGPISFLGRGFGFFRFLVQREKTKARPGIRTGDLPRGPTFYGLPSACSQNGNSVREQAWECPLSMTGARRMSITWASYLSKNQRGLEWRWSGDGDGEVKRREETTTLGPRLVFSKDWSSLIHGNLHPRELHLRQKLQICPHVHWYVQQESLCRGSPE